MATTSKKSPKKAKAKPPSPSSKKSRSKEAQTIEGLRRELADALEQQTATSEILRVIASSPTDLQPVLNTIAENATRLCDAKDVSIGLVEGDVLKVVASHGMMARWWPDEGVPINRGSVTGRTIVDRQPIHV
ncbi:MAG TPA: hypothetical protein VN966_03405, partial [Candidatus Bathyarchaeia archaeon]|nr:hypothetical protein [Candidatus Bathyarchaeia archaeon]